MGLTNRVPGLSTLRRRLNRAGGQGGAPLDGHALLAAVGAAGPEGSSHRLIAIVSAYEDLKGRLDPASWHTVPGLLDFVRETGEYIPMIPGPILARVREGQGSPIRPHVFLIDWEGEGRPVERMDVDAAGLLDTITSDREQAEAFIARTGCSDGVFFNRYLQWHHSLTVAEALGAERVIDFGASSPEFGHLLASRMPGVEVCAIDDRNPDGLQPVGERVYRLGAPPFDLGLFDDESVDLIVAHNRFERLLGNADRMALAEVERVLVRGGRFLIAPFMSADQHALTVSPFPCFIANGETDYGAAIEAEMHFENARVEFNVGVVTPVTRRYDVSSAVRRLLESAPNMSARVRPMTFADDGFDGRGAFAEPVFGFSLRQDLLNRRSVLVMEFIKH